MMQARKSNPVIKVALPILPMRAAYIKWLKEQDPTVVNIPDEFIESIEDGAFDSAMSIAHSKGVTNPQEFNEQLDSFQQKALS